MTTKFREKYADKMNPEQQSLFESYLLNDMVAVESKVANIKNRAKKVLNSYFLVCENNILSEKRSEVEQKIDALEINSTQDSVSKAMLLSSLLYEMETRDV